VTPGHALTRTCQLDFACSTIPRTTSRYLSLRFVLSSAFAVDSSHIRLSYITRPPVT
jgi:hypothetical protein